MHDPREPYRPTSNIPPTPGSAELHSLRLALSLVSTMLYAEGCAPGLQPISPHYLARLTWTLRALRQLAPRSTAIRVATEFMDPALAPIPWHLPSEIERQLLRLAERAREPGMQPEGN